MPYRLPVFNLSGKVWTGPVMIPPGGAARLTVQCSIRVYKTAFAVTTENANACVVIRFPALTDIRPKYGLVQGMGSPDVIECPAGSGRFYEAEALEDVAKGFANEYRLVVVKQLGRPAGYPIP